MLPYLLWLNFTVFEYAALSLASAYGSQHHHQQQQVQTSPENEENDEENVAGQTESSISNGNTESGLKTLSELNKEAASEPINLVQKTISFLLRQSATTSLPQQQFYYRGDQPEDSSGWGFLRSTFLLLLVPIPFSKVFF